MNEDIDIDDYIRMCDINRKKLFKFVKKIKAQSFLSHGKLQEQPRNSENPQLIPYILPT